MTIRAIPCPKCRRVPVTEVLESEQCATYCTTAKCKMKLYALGKTEDDSRNCWNNCIDRRDY